MTGALHPALRCYARHAGGVASSSTTARLSSYVSDTYAGQATGYINDGTFCVHMRLRRFQALPFLAGYHHEWCRLVV